MKNIELQKQLCQFGLNPHDWVVQKMSAGAYAVKSRKDQEMYFWGKIIQTADQVKWQKLQIAL